MTHEEAVKAVKEVVNNHPAWAVEKDNIGVTVWSVRGFDEWYAPRIHAIEHAVKGNIINHKQHAYEMEPGSAYEVYISDTDVCEGGCCDGAYKYATPWEPYDRIPTYYS